MLLVNARGWSWNKRFSEECKLPSLKSVFGILNFVFFNEKKKKNNEHFTSNIEREDSLKYGALPNGENLFCCINFADWLISETYLRPSFFGQQLCLRETSIIDVWQGRKYDTLRDLVAFLQFKKREKQPWRSVNFSIVAGWSLQLY